MKPRAPKFPFDEQPNVAVITTAPVLNAAYPILIVDHDEEDGSWAFLCGTTNADEDLRLVALSEIFDIDPSIGELADLPLGWRAWRSGLDEPWRRVKDTWDNDTIQ